MLSLLFMVFLLLLQCGDSRHAYDHLMFFLYYTMLFCMLIGATDTQLVLYVGNTVKNQVIVFNFTDVDGGMEEDVTGIY